MSTRWMERRSAVRWLSLAAGLTVLVGCGQSKPTIFSVMRNFEHRNYPKVVEECHALLAENAGNVQAHRFLIKASKQLGTLESLTQEYAQRIGEDSADAVAHFAEGYALVQAREWERALLELQTAQELDPTIEYVNYVIGWIHFNPLTPYYDEGKAMELWDREAELDASSLGALQVYRDLGGYYRNLGQFEEAREQLRAFHDHAFSEGDRIAARDMLEQLEQREIEVVQLQQSADAEDAETDVLIAYGTRLFRWKRQAEAIPYWERAAEQEPDNADLHNFLGMAHMELGQDPDAIASFERALELRADFAEPHYNLGMLKDTLGNEPQALSHYESYLEMQPFSEQAEVLRRRVEELRGKNASPAGANSAESLS